MTYIALPLYIIGFVVIGAAFENHLTIGALVRRIFPAVTQY